MPRTTSPKACSFELHVGGARRYRPEMFKPVALAIALAALTPATAGAQTFTRSPGETAQKFAERALNLPADSAETDRDAHILETTWNGRTVVFVDYLVTTKTFDARQKETVEDTNRFLVALEDTGHGVFRKLDVTLGEEEGGIADIAAIGFANADKDLEKELVVILKWEQALHADYAGTEYEVRIFDNAAPSQSRLAYLQSVSKQFGGNICDCEYDDGAGRVRKQRARYKTVADVNKHLKELGF